MKKIIIFTLCSLLSLSFFSQEEKIKYRKLEYTDFTKLSINDTSLVIIDIFFDKKDNAGLAQMSFLPITAALIVIPLTKPIGVVLTTISLPLFTNGSYMMLKYRNKKLHMVLTEYKKSNTLPKWVRKKANKHLFYIEELKSTY